MSFLFPLFLLAGLSIAIPVLIHLFNLRKYKTIDFPNIRFLKNIQIHSQKQSQIRYKWLLLLRVLFLISLILAFAQPYFNSNKKKTIDRLQVIYLDNSCSMSVKKGARSLLDVAKDAIRQQLKNSSPNSKYLLLSNNQPVSYEPMSATKAIDALNQIDITPVTKKASQTLARIEGLLQSDALNGADIYYYTDFSRNSFDMTSPLADNLHFYGLPVRAENLNNLYIDTAFLTTPVLQVGQTNRLVVRTKLIGKPTNETPVLQLSINGQVKNAATLNFNEKAENIDTLSFHVNDGKWQEISLTVNDQNIRLDDTFRITAKSASNLSVLVLNQNQQSPYLQAAFSAQSGFTMDQKSINESGDWGKYNLIVLNNVLNIGDGLAQQIKKELQQGQSVCIFPGKTNDLQLLNDGLHKIADISFNGIDTALQSATTLQQGSDIVQDLFERIPDNIELPKATWHYHIVSGLSANQQSVLSFRNGDPFLAQYTPSRGKLYITATSIDLSSGNFPTSYFFVPFLYQMAVQSKGSNVYAITAGKQQSVFVPLNNSDERNMVHVLGNGTDMIPPQRPEATGLNIFIGQEITQPGFYRLAAHGLDTTIVAINSDRASSDLKLWDLDKLSNQWKGNNIHWEKITNNMTHTPESTFPLWKVCVILALLMLALESYLLASGYHKKTVVS